jgi:methylated-DNA-protein-cysteine methyltransferase-like protein
MRKTMSSDFHQRVRQVIKRIPKGKVATYGQIALLAGDPRAARQVAWVLNSSSKRDKLPWHRVINSQGKISLPKGGGYELQGVNLKRYQWVPRGRSEKT